MEDNTKLNAHLSREPGTIVFDFNLMSFENKNVSPNHQSHSPFVIILMDIKTYLTLFIFIAMAIDMDQARRVM